MKILALDVGGTAVKSAIVDEANGLSDIRVSPSSPSPPDVLIQHALDVVRSYTDFDVLAVSMTGQIDANTQSVLARTGKNGFESVNFPAGQVLQEAVQRPVFILNDANAAALAEGCFGAGKNYKDFLCLTYGTGVGGGIISDGKLYTGHLGIAGEFGHIVTHARGRVCRCRKRGCYQQYASTTALVREAKKVDPSINNAKELFAKLSEEPKLNAVVDKWIDEIVEGLCTVSYIFNPACIVLGGGVMERPEVLEQVRVKFQKRIIPSFGKVALLPAALGNHAGLMGAAAYARQMLADE